MHDYYGSKKEYCYCTTATVVLYILPVHTDITNVSKPEGQWRKAAYMHPVHEH